jgi:(p)ppGpp synthase/HD superfamily hydrolase
MTEHDALLLAAADALAAWLHREDVDLQGEPTIHHCRRVAATLREQGWRAEVQAAGVLHDCIEARHVSMDDLDMIFHDSSGKERVAFLIKLVSRENDEAIQPYSEYIEDIANSGPAVIAIKLADLADNLDPARGSIPASLRKRYEKAVARLEAAGVPW